MSARTTPGFTRRGSRPPRPATRIYLFSAIPDKISSASEDAANTAVKRINANAAQLKSSFDDYTKQSASKAVAGMVEAVITTVADQ